MPFFMVPPRVHANTSGDITGRAAMKVEVDPHLIVTSDAFGRKVCVVAGPSVPVPPGIFCVDPLAGPVSVEAAFGSAAGARLALERLR